MGSERRVATSRHRVSRSALTARTRLLAHSGTGCVRQGNRSYCCASKYQVSRRTTGRRFGRSGNLGLPGLARAWPVWVAWGSEPAARSSSVVHSTPFVKGRLRPCCEFCVRVWIRPDSRALDSWSTSITSVLTRQSLSRSINRSDQPRHRPHGLRPIPSASRTLIALIGRTT
jgi:hypothetical protein